MEPSTSDSILSGPWDEVPPVAEEGAGVSMEELQLAARNHGMQLEGLRYDITPIGMHYLLIHFDVPLVDEETFRLDVGGHVRAPLTLTLADVRAGPGVSLPVTLECSGNGRARFAPRPISQPWLHEAVGTAEWTGTPLAPVLERAGVKDGAVEVVFTGRDRGVQGGIEQDYEFSVPIDEALRPEVLLAYEMNGLPLPPQHGFPLRVIVPGWYGMTHVKWLKRITVVTEPFSGYQKADAYRVMQHPDEEGTKVSRILPRSLMMPPGVPDFITRLRLLPVGPTVLEGRAWSGRAAIDRVEVSTEGGSTWGQADLEPPVSEHAWRRWTFRWEPDGPGDYELVSRATDAAGNAQPLEQPWNYKGHTNNMVQRVRAQVRADLADA
jgi:DMSO/TMAO reductase YedYZ molybdopterin-dependent catalytic subunit